MHRGWEENVKIGIMLPISESDDGDVPRYADVRARAMQVEGDGFDSIWLAEPKGRDGYTMCHTLVTESERHPD